MQANKRTLDDIFSPTTRFLAPLFQRPYVWNRDENWLPLWESVRDAAEQRLQSNNAGRPHFLGAVVLNQLGNATGSIQAREIIDGQQRLTTLQLFITALRDFSDYVHEQNYQRAFGQWVENFSPGQKSADSSFKVWPTNFDRQHFRNVLQATSPFAVYHTYRTDAAIPVQQQGFGATDDPAVRSFLLRRAGLSDEDRDAAYSSLTKVQQQEAGPHIEAFKKIVPLIPNAYLYFSAVLIEWLGTPQDADFQLRLDAIYQTMKQDLVIVVIDLDTQDDAQQIFETMNALGAPLLPADLVKNFLFRLADQQGVASEHLYNRYWHVFDSEPGWREKVRQGRLLRPRIDLFLQHYLTLETGEDVLATDLFNAYRRWNTAKPKMAEDQLAHFRRYADIYWKFERFPTGSREALFFSRVAQLDTTTIFPLLLEVFARHHNPGEEKDIRAIMVDLESYLVRRAICGLTPKNYNQFFRSLAQQLTASNDFSHATIHQALLRQTADTTRWPDDMEFRAAWMTRPLYRNLVRQRTRMILEALEGQLHNPLSSTHTITGIETIEHFMPQAWQQHWPLPGQKNPDDEARDREAVIQTIGNLTILSSSLNPKISNREWLVKLPDIQQHNALGLNLGLPPVWDENTITARGAKLFQAALAIWPR